MLAARGASSSAIAVNARSWVVIRPIAPRRQAREDSRTRRPAGRASWCRGTSHRSETAAAPGRRRDRAIARIRVISAKNRERPSLKRVLDAQCRADGQRRNAQRGSANRRTGQRKHGVDADASAATCSCPTCSSRLRRVVAYRTSASRRFAPSAEAVPVGGRD